MTRQSFSLIAFPALRIPKISIDGQIAFHNNCITLQYQLTGQIEELLLPAPSNSPGRRDELWRATCFEFFLAIKGQPQYWEFNLSPSGDWNSYRMDAYRRVGFQEEALIQKLPFQLQSEQTRISVAANADLSPIIEQGHVLEIGITAILQTLDGSETYWALAHPGAEADFHRRESFVLELTNQAFSEKQSQLQS